MLLPDLDGMRRDKQWIVMTNGGKNILRYVLLCVAIFFIIYDCWTIAHLLLLYLIVEMS
jgi:hypothetical protein